MKQFVQSFFYNDDAAKAAAEARSEQENIERYSIYFKGASSAMMLSAISHLDPASTLGWFIAFCASDQLAKVAYKNRSQIYDFGARVVNDTIAYGKKTFTDIQKPATASPRR